jgi:phosphate transporter
MDPRLDWARWFVVAIPVSAISIFLIWLLLLVSYRPSRLPAGEGELEIKPIRANREPFTLQQYWVSFVCLVTIGLWCVEHEIEGWVGDMGIIAILPIVAFFSTGVLKKVRCGALTPVRRVLMMLARAQDDFEQFMWTIVFLAMGGIALGKGVMASGLLDIMDIAIRNLAEGLSVWTVVLALAPVVLVRDFPPPPL